MDKNIGGVKLQTEKKDTHIPTREEGYGNMVVLSDKNYFIVYLKHVIFKLVQFDEVVLSTTGLATMAEEIVDLLVKVRLCDIPTLKDRTTVELSNRRIATQIKLRVRAVNRKD